MQYLRVLKEMKGNEKQNIKKTLKGDMMWNSSQEKEKLKRMMERKEIF